MNNQHLANIAARLRLCAPRFAPGWREETKLAELGLDSLDSVEFLCAINEEFGVRVREEDFGPGQTLGGLCDSIAQQLSAAAVPGGAARSALWLLLAAAAACLQTGCLTGHILQRSSDNSKKPRTAAIEAEGWLHCAAILPAAAIDLAIFPLEAFAWREPKDQETKGEGSN